MRTLAIVDEIPYPVSSGGRLRISTILDGLARLGDVDLVAIRSSDKSDQLELPADDSIARALVVERPRYRGRSYARWLRSTLPYDVTCVDYSDMRIALTGFVDTPYDFQYVRPLGLHLGLNMKYATAIMLDCDDLQNRLLAGSLRTVGPSAGRSGGLRGAIHESRARVDVRRWRRAQDLAVLSADAVFVASESDRLRLATHNAVVVPNSYPVPPQALGRIDADRTPTLTMIGTLTWPPNRDAANRLVETILPLIHRVLPDAQVRLVGYADEAIHALAQHPGVTVTGPLTTLDAELARADVMAVPIRFAGGTRIKIIEAFAHGIPVVASRVGCEGLDAVPEVHLLVADDPQAFATSCVRLLQDVELRSKITCRAQMLYQSRFRADRIEDLVMATAQQLSVQL